MNLKQKVLKIHSRCDLPVLEKVRKKKSKFIRIGQNSKANPKLQLQNQRKSHFLLPSAFINILYYWWFTHLSWSTNMSCSLFSTKFSNICVQRSQEQDSIPTPAERRRSSCRTCASYSISHSGSHSHSGSQSKVGGLEVGRKFSTADMDGSSRSRERRKLFAQSRSKELFLSDQSNTKPFLCLSFPSWSDLMWRVWQAGVTVVRRCDSMPGQTTHLQHCWSQTENQSGLLRVWYQEV